jgi:hypothetical protein
MVMGNPVRSEWPKQGVLGKIPQGALPAWSMGSQRTVSKKLANQYRFENLFSNEATTASTV